MFKKPLSVVVSLLSFISLFFFFGCQVGLGEAVDTAAPTISITYPPAASTIRDTFVLSGICDDDRAVTSVTVEIRNTDMNQSFGSYNADVSGKRWQVRLNGSGSYNGWQMPDGRYVAEARAYDAIGRASGVSSLSFDIDNTPPLFILSSPGNDTKTSGSATKFGSVFKFAGTIAEDHTVSKVSVTVKDVATNSEKGTFSRSNVETAGGTNITFAEKGNVKETDDDGHTLDANYRTIYGDYDTEKGAKLFYCEVTVTDSARKYTGSDSDETAGGNKTNSIYFYDDVYNAWLSTASGLDATKAKKIINGTYAGEFVTGDFDIPKLLESGEIDRSRGKDNKYLMQYTDGKEAFEYVRDKLFRTTVAFSLDPDADPTYSVIGYNMKKDDVTSYAQKNDEEAKKKFTTAFSAQQVTVQAICGLNGYGVVPSSIKVYQYGPFELNELNNELITSIYDGSYNVSEKTLLIKDNHDDPAASAESYSLSATLDGSILGNKFYVIRVTGEDTEHQKLKTSAGNVVVLKGELAGTPPTVVINEHSALKTLLGRDPLPTETPDDQAVVGSSDISFSGTIDEGSTVPTIKFTVTVSNAEDGNYIGKFEKEFDHTNEKTQHGYRWSFNLKDAQDYISTPENSYYMYNVIVHAENNGGGTDKERRVFVDTIKPVITLTSITPECLKDNDDNRYLNGTFKITGKAEDTHLENVWFEIKSKGDPIVSSKDFTDKDANGKLRYQGQWYSFNEEITIDSTDTAKFNTKDGKDIEIIVHAVDKAGNEGTRSTNQYLGIEGKTYKIEQTTDNPVITGNNFVLVTDTNKLTANAPEGSEDSGNVFDTTSNHNLMFTVTDDDGVSSVKVVVRNLDGTSAISDDDADGTVSIGGKDLNYKSMSGLVKKPTTASMTFKNLPIVAGVYEVIIIANDSTYSESLPAAVKKFRTTTYGPFKVAIDKTNPELSEIFKNTVDTQYANNDKDINYGGLISDDFKLADAPLKLYIKAPNGKYIKGDGTDDSKQEGISITPTDTSQGQVEGINGEWTYNFTVPAGAADGMYELTFTATDNFGRTTSVSRSVCKDTTKPEISINSITPTVKKENKRYLNGTFNVTGTVTENYLDTVWYEIKSNDGSKNVTLDSRALTPKVEGQWWAFNSEVIIDSTNKATYKTYDDTPVEIIIHAKDKAGNENTKSTTEFAGGVSYEISQVTDKPEITGNNFAFIDAIGDDDHSAEDNKANLTLESDIANGKGNIFDASTNRKLIGSVTDDDGIQNITVYIAKENGSKINSSEYAEYGITSDALPLSGFTVGSTSLSFNYQLPSKAGIYQVSISAVDTTYAAATGSEGVTVDAVRANRQALLGPFFVAVDDKVPELTETKVNSNDILYIREDDVNTTTKDEAAVSFGGKVSDDWGIKSLECSVSFQGASAQDVTTETALKALGGTITPVNDTWAKTISFKNNSYNYSAGTYTITFKVTDKAGKETSVVRKVYKDTVAPEFGTSAITNPEASGYEETAVKPYITTEAVNGWYNTNTLRISGGVKDAASGVKKVEYTLDTSSQNPTWHELAGTSLFSGTVPEVVNGGTIKLRATDVAGNYSDTGISGIKIDTGMPGAVITAIDGETTGLGNKLSNGQENIALAGTATDALSGIEWIKITVGDKSFTDPAVTLKVTRNTQGEVTDTPFVSARDAGGNAILGTYTWNASIPASKITKSGTVWAQICDVAGNTTEVNLFSLQVDKERPTVDFNSTIKEATVNKLITISGTANDDQKLGSIKLEYQASEKEWKDVTLDGTLDGATVSGTYNWTLTDIDSQKAFGTSIYDCDSIKPGDQVNIRVTATDAAGNERTASTFITVDQNTDRPVVSFTNLNPLDGMSSNNYLFFNNTKVLGNLTDDDGINSDVILKIIARKVINGKSQAAPTLEEFQSPLVPVVTLSSGSWNYVFPNNDSQGKQDVYFYVKDAKGGEFISKAIDYSKKADGTYNKPGDSYDSVYLQDETNEFGNIVHPESILYIRIDTVPPEQKNLVFNFFSKKDNSYLKADDAQDWSDSIADYIFGGNTPKFAIRLDASDANGIKSVKGTIGDKEYTFSKVTGKVDDEGNGTYILKDILTGNKASTGNLKDGVNYFNIIITDNADTTKSTTLVLNVDNTLPVVKVQNPTTLTTVSGNVSAYGTVDEASKMYYAISLSGTISPDDNTTSITSYKDIAGVSTAIADVKDKINYQELKGAALSWYIYFDGDSDPSQTVAHDAKTLNKYLVDYGITTEEEIDKESNPFDTIVKLYMWVKAVDKAGNETEVAHEIKLDPQGDRPTASISYPEHDGDTLGGSIKVYGEANDNKSVESVWLQVISKNNHASDWDNVVAYSGTSPAYNITKFEPTKADLDFLAEKGYAVYCMADYKPAGGSNKAWKKGDVLGTGKTASDYAILCNSSGSTWNVKINVKDELNPASGVSESNVIAIRVLARDGDSKVSIPSDRIFEIDSDKPVFGSSQPFYLVQSADVSWDTTSTASREYTEDMYVKGQWYLIGSVEDDVGIKSLTLKDNISSKSSVMISEKSVQAGGTDFDVKIVDKVAYFKIKLPTTIGVGSLDYTFTAEDIAQGTSHSQTKDIKVNFDNNAPVLIGNTAAGYNINPSVKQSNNFYVFGSSVKEDAVTSGGTTVNQSGFDYVAFYFMRRSDKTTDKKDYIYDIMQPRKIDSADNAANKIEVNSSLTYEDGLFWKAKKVTRNENHLGLIKLSAADSNIHVGGLVKIGGTIYYISSISSDGTEISVNGNIPVTYTDAKFACAMVVNNTVQETDSGSLLPDGYYLKPANDDGDRMIESVTKTGTTWAWEADICSKNIPDGPIELHYVAFDKAGNFNIGIVGCVDTTTYNRYQTEDVKQKTTNPVSVYAFDSEKPAFVSNNQPRIAGVIFGSDDNANGRVDPIVRDASGSITSYGEMNVSYGGWYNSADPYGNKKQGITVNGKKANGEAVNTFNIPEGLDSAALTIKGETKIIPEIVGGNNGLSYTYSVTKSGETTPYFNSSAEVLSDEDSITDDVRSNIEINLTTVKLLTPDSKSKTIADGKNQKFEFKIWDKTEGTISGSNSQYASINMIANVVLKDSEKAKVWFKPFFWRWNSTTRSIETSIYEDDVTKGHIELEADWKKTAGTTGGYAATATSGVTDGDPKVSGIISMRGTATDNVLVNEIWVKIPNFIAGTNDTANRNHVKVAQRNATTGKWESTGTIETNGYEFVLDGEEAFDQTEGNTVNFIFSWNTAKITGVARYDVPVEILAKDKGSISLNADKSLKYTTTGASSASTAQTGSLDANSKEQLTPYYKMDVVPYITRVTTSLSGLKTNNPSVYARTAKGHYSVRANETVKLFGFNLAVDTDNVDLAMSGVPTSGKYAWAVTNEDASNNVVSSLNNINANNSCGTYADEEGKEYTDNNYAYCYNRQPNGDNNNLLTDDIEFDIWDINSNAVKPISGRISQPVMKINPLDGQISFAFVNGPLFFSMGGLYSDNLTSYDYWCASYDFFTSVGFGIDNNGNTYGCAAGGDINSSSADNFCFFSSRFGTGGRTKRGSLGGTNALRLEQVAQSIDNVYNFNKERIQSPSIATAVHGTVTDVYLAYYDDMNSEIRFKYGALDENKKKSFGNFNDEYNAASPTTENNSEPKAYSIADDVLIAGTKSGTSTGYNAGEFVSLAVISSEGAIAEGGTADDVVVLVWYDSTARKLMYTYNLSPLTSRVGCYSYTSTADKYNGWSTPVAVFGSNVNIGEYCKIATDANGGVHIAAYDSANADVVYATLPSSKKGVATSSGDFTTCVVDSYGIIGTELTIDVGLNSSGVAVPHIGYYAQSCVRPKMAYPVNPGTIADGSINESFTGNWEVSLVPTTSAVPMDHINVNLWKNRNGGNVGVIKNSTTTSTIMRSTDALQNGSGTTYTASGWGHVFGNGTPNAVMGYQIKVGTGGFIETAQMK